MNIFLVVPLKWLHACLNLLLRILTIIKSYTKLDIEELTLCSSNLLLLHLLTIFINYWWWRAEEAFSVWLMSWILKSNRPEMCRCSYEDGADSKYRYPEPLLFSPISFLLILLPHPMILLRIEYYLESRRFNLSCQPFDSVFPRIFSKKQYIYEVFLT